MSMTTPMKIRCASAALALLALAACSSGPTGPAGGEPQAAAPGGPSGAQIAPPVDMAGRWTLASSAGGACGINFRPTTGVGEGAIAPEGGCPGNFFTSRKWTYESTGLVIRDHTGKPLAQLAAAGAGRFEGRTSEGAGITLSR